jgi:hypothetical protein
LIDPRNQLVIDQFYAQTGLTPALHMICPHHNTMTTHTTRRYARPDERPAPLTGRADLTSRGERHFINKKR